jgi:hypothetical protein
MFVVEFWVYIIGIIWQLMIKVMEHILIKKRATFLTYDKDQNLFSPKYKSRKFLDVTAQFLVAYLNNRISSAAVVTGIWNFLRVQSNS